MTTGKIETTVLIPDEGKYLYDGETISDKVYLGINASADDWREITAEEKAQLETEGGE